MTPTEIVLSRFTPPPYISEVHPLQVACINALADLPNEGHWLDMGCGKTLVATFVGLFHRLRYGHPSVVVMPPLLVTQWARWLRGFTPKLNVVAYEGTPKERAAMSFEGADFVLVGIQIFKKEFARFNAFFDEKDFTFIVDEATMVANIESANYQRCFDFSIGRPRVMLTGTPLNNPMDTYGLMKFSAPGAYKNIKQFENLHVEERDFFKRPVRFKNLGILKERLMTNACRILYEDMHKDSEPPLFTPLNYELEQDHKDLYHKLAEEQMLELENGGKIDATSANRLTHALGQIVVNWGHFAGKPGLASSAVQLIEEKLDEMGDEKLVVFCHYKLTANVLKEKLAKYGCVVVNGDVTQTQKQKNLERFTSDKTCRVIVIQFISGGKGLDGLQHVCYRCLFIEPCQQPRDFHQCVARLKRTGQRKRVQVMLAIARGTLQVRGFKNLLNNDDVVNQVIRNAYDLRQMIYGN